MNGPFVFAKRTSKAASGAATGSRNASGSAARGNDAERVAVEPRVLGCEEHLCAAEPHADRPALAQKSLREAGVGFVGEQMPAPAQAIVELVGVPRRRPQRLLHLLDRAAVEEVAELLRPP